MIQLVVQLPPPIHGAALMNKYLSDSIVKTDFDVELVPINASKSTGDIGKFSLSKVWNSLYVLSKIYKGRRDTKAIYLVMSVTGFAFYRDVLFVLLANILKKKTILHLHGKGFSTKKGLPRFLVSYVFKRSYLIQLSNLLSGDTTQFERKGTFTVPNGWPDVYEGFSKTALKRNKKVEIVFFSNLIEQKGLFIALEAICELTRKGLREGFVVHFMGAWKNECTKQEFYKTVKINGIEDLIGEVGPKYNEEKYKFLSKMDIMIFPTFYSRETWGLVNIEAMMFKLPVISTPEGAIPDIVEDGITGFIVPRKDSRALADKIMLLIQDHDLRVRMGELGRNKFIEKYKIEQFEKNMERTFRSVLSSKPTGRKG